MDNQTSTSFHWYDGKVSVKPLDGRTLRVSFGERSKVTVFPQDIDDLITLRDALIEVIDDLTQAEVEPIVNSEETVGPIRDNGNPYETGIPY